MEINQGTSGGPGTGIAIGDPIIGGTDGSVLFVHPDEILAQDNANFYYSFANKRLGLGLTIPIGKLHVQETYTNPTTSRYGLAFSVDPDITSASNQKHYGIAGVVQIAIANGITEADSIFGIQAGTTRNQADDFGTLGNQIGEVIEVGHYSTANSSIVTTNTYGSQVRQYANLGTMTSVYGYAVLAQSSGATITNSYGFYSDPVVGSGRTYGLWTTKDINTSLGYQIGQTATTGNVLRGNGTRFVDAQLQYSDLGGVPSTFPPSAHNFLDSTVHNNTTTGTPTRGDLITGQGAPATWKKLAIGSNTRVLKSDGTDANWGTVNASEVANGTALTKTDDTNVTLTLGGSPTTALLAATSLALGWTGTLAYARFVNGAGLSVVGRSANTAGVQADITAGADFNILRRSGTSIGFGSIDLSQSGAVGSSVLNVVNGGTSLATLTAHAVYVGNGTSAPTALAVGANNTVLRGSTGADPAFGAIQTGDLPALGANPSVNVTLSVQNGTATTYLRSDGAPALSQAIAPTWSADHIWLHDNIVLTPDDMIYLKNTTASTNGVRQQISPSINFLGSSWNTGGGTNSTSNMRVYNRPAGAVGFLAVTADDNGGGYNTVFTLSSAGAVVLGTNGVGNGPSLAFNGATSGQALMGPIAAAGSPVIILPTQSGQLARVFTGSDAGGDDTYVITPVQAPGAYAAGDLVVFTATTGNTLAATCDYGAGAATIVKRSGGTTLATGDIPAGGRAICIYDGTNLVLLNPVAQ